MSDLFRWMTESGISLFAVVGWIGVGVAAWMNIRWRVKNLEQSHAELKANQKDLERIIEKQVEVTRTVELNSVRLTEIAKASERRLQLVEDRQ